MAGNIEAQLKLVIEVDRLDDTLNETNKRPSTIMYEKSASALAPSLGLLKKLPSVTDFAFIALPTASVTHKNPMRTGARTAFLRSVLHHKLHPNLLLLIALIGIK